MTLLLFSLVYLRYVLPVHKSAWHVIGFYFVLFVCFGLDKFLLDRG